MGSTGIVTPTYTKVEGLHPRSPRLSNEISLTNQVGWVPRAKYRVHWNSNIPVTGKVPLAHLNSEFTRGGSHNHPPDINPILTEVKFQLETIPLYPTMRPDADVCAWNKQTYIQLVGSSKSKGQWCLNNQAVIGLTCGSLPQATALTVPYCDLKRLYPRALV